MSDDRLRELARRFQNSGSQADEVAYLQARLRAGELELEGVQRLSGLGYPAARVVVGEAAEPLPADSDAWSERLARLGQLAVARGALACVDQALRVWRDAFQGEEPGLLDVEAVALARRLQDVCERWLAHGEGSALEVRRTCRELYEQGERRWADAVPLPRAASLANLALVASQLLPLGEQVEERWDHEVEFDRRLPFYEFLLLVANGAERYGRPGAVLSAAAREVCRWALGYQDALAERVERRKHRSGEHQRLG